MGFNLKSFFEELETILDNKNLSAEQRLEAIQEEVNWQKDYAIQCKQI